MNTQKTFTTTDLNKLCKRVEKLTDWNQHTEARKVICKRLGYLDLCNQLDIIDAFHNKIGYLTEDLSNERLSITKAMFMRVYSDCADCVTNRLKACL